MQDLLQDEMFGIAKKMSRELAEYPLHTNGALIQLINIAFEHRKLTQQRAEKLANDKMQEQALRMQEQHLALMQADEQRKAASRIHLAQGEGQQGSCQMGKESRQAAEPVDLAAQ
jgi:ribosomal protein L24